MNIQDDFQPVHGEDGQGSFDVDPHPPDYFVVSLHGLIDDALASRYRQAVLDMHARLIRAGFGACPAILDYHDLRMSNWSVARFARVHGGVFKPGHRFAAIESTDPDQSIFAHAVTSFGVSLYRNSKIVKTLDEAIAAVTGK